MMLRTRKALAWTFSLAVVAACGDAATQGGSQDSGDAGITDASVSPADGAISDASHADSSSSKDAATDAFVEAAADAGKPVDHSHAALRVMAANTTSGTQQSYEGPGIRIFQGFNPDVVLIQEFKYAAGTLRNLVDTAFGASFSYYVETRVGGIPNGIVSRYPILDSGTWVDASVSDRAFVWARIDIPGPTDLWAISLHLLTTGITQRDTEAKQLVMNIQASIPAGDFLVLGGDLNTDATDELALMDLGAVVNVAGPYPVDQANNNNTSTNRNRPHDWVLANPGLDALAVPVLIGASSFQNGLVFDTRVYTPLAEVSPILSTDSAAAGMQHMPVIRDFMVESPADGGADAADGL